MHQLSHVYGLQRQIYGKLMSFIREIALYFDAEQSGRGR